MVVFERYVEGESFVQRGGDGSYGIVSLSPPSGNRMRAAAGSVQFLESRYDQTRQLSVARPDFGAEEFLDVAQAVGVYQHAGEDGNVRRSFTQGKSVSRSSVAFRCLGASG